MTALLDYFTARRDDMVGLLRELVELESPTHDPIAVNRVGQRISTELAQVGATVEVQERIGRGNNVVGRYGGDTSRPALLIGHMDTVWKEGTLALRPFRIDGDRAYGPGTADMKAGLVIMLYVLRAINELGLSLAHPVTLLFTSDEEMRSEHSRDLIMHEAEQSACALIMEGSDAVDTFCTQRKASGRFWVRAFGRAAHAGGAIQLGINAIHELALQVPVLEAMTDLEIGTTVNVGVIHGGDRPNIVPDWAEAELSVRAPSHAEMERIKGELLGLKPGLDGAKLEVTGDFHRPPYETTERNRELFQVLREAAATFGVEARGRSSGGASDANLTSGAGTPTLDGLGAVGAGAHSIEEYIDINALPLRAAITAELLRRLT